MSVMKGLFSSVLTSKGSLQSVRKVADRALFLTSDSSYSSGRTLAKVAVDWATFCELKVLPKDVKGKKHVKLQAEIGFDEYNALREDAGLVLLKITYCQVSLSDVLSLKKLIEGSKLSEADGQQLENIKKMKELINHDYLVLEIHSNDLELPTIFIKAEKVSAPDPGIHISSIPPEKISQVLHQGVKLFAIDCNSKIGMDNLVTALTKEKADYSLRDANCWDYALATTKTVLKGCAEVPGLSADEKTRLLREHDSVKSNLACLHIRNTVKNLIDGFGKLISSSSAS